MAKKENIKFKTSITETEIELRPYVDARTDQANSAVYLQYAKFDFNKAIQNNKTASGKAPTEAEAEALGKDAMKFDTLPGTAIAEIKNNAIKGMVVSLDGDNKGGDRDAILEAVLDLPKDEYDEIQAKIDEITKASKLDPKGGKN